MNCLGCDREIHRIITAFALGLGVTLALLGLLAGSTTLAAPPPTYSVNTLADEDDGCGVGFCSLREAISAANGSAGHDIIGFSVSGIITLTDDLPAIADNVTINGPGAALLSVSGAYTHRPFYINAGVAVTISGLTVRDGYHPSLGGGIWSAGNLRLMSASIVSNSTGHSGGGVFVDQGSVTLVGGQVTSNSTQWYGGGLYIGSGSLTLDGTQVRSNSADYGGGLYVGSGGVTLSGAQVISNSAGYGGGGVFVYEGSATLNGAQVFSNSVPYGDGGGVYVDESIATLSMNGGEMRGNVAYSGGAMFVFKGSATLTGTQLINNSVSSHGGGLYVDKGSATLIGAHVINNSAQQDGGGLYAHMYMSELNMNGTEFRGNSASSYGGGLYIRGDAALSATQVLSNSAGHGGGGLYVYRASISATLSISGGEIGYNTVSGSNPSDGGGGIYVYLGTPMLSATRVFSNSADYGRGGGVYVGQGVSTLSMSGGEISGNSAAHGGGVYVYYDYAGLIMSGGEIRNNSASSDGGGLYVDMGRAVLAGTQVVSNSTLSSGGGVFVNQGSAMLSMSGGGISSNSASFGDGGGLHINDGSGTLTDTQVVSNSAPLGDGGGVYVNLGSAELSMSGGEVGSNSASSKGGGVFLYQGSATLSDTQVLGNSAYYGGGVFVSQASVTLSISEGEVSGNSASHSGGGMCVSDGSAALTGTQIISNSAPYGGGLFLAHGDATLEGAQVFSNSAEIGGGLYVDDSSMTLVGTQVRGNSAEIGGGLVADGSLMTLASTQVAHNDAPQGSAVCQFNGILVSTTPLTITGDVYQQSGILSASNNDLRIDGSLVMTGTGGHFYAPNAPHEFILTGPFTHTGGTFHQTRPVDGSAAVGFPGPGGVIINANGLDLGSTAVALTAGTSCPGASPDIAVGHCYLITPTDTSGVSATITFFYQSFEEPAGSSCNLTEAFRWDGTWDNMLTRDATYGTNGRMCGGNLRSIQVRDVTAFSPFVLRSTNIVYLPFVLRNP